MFIGHFAAGLALKKAAPAVSLGTLFLAAQFLDLLWPTLLLCGVEHVEIAPGSPGPPLRFSHYPISHSLALVVGWAVLFGAIHYAVKKSTRGAIVCAVAVVSHWLLDLLVHLPDLPLAPGGVERVGLGLWRSLPWSLALEIGWFVAACWIYARCTAPRDAIGRWAWLGLVVFLFVVHLSNVFGPPPPSVTAVAWVGQAQWLFVAWGYWIDAHRERRGDCAAPPAPAPVRRA